MQMLKAKLYMLKEEDNEALASELRGEVSENGFGSQIRSYVFQPYKMVKDHRTKAEEGNVDKVMDGNISHFINEYLKFLKEQ